MTEPKVIPHKKPRREPKPYKAPKPKRYAVEFFSYNEDRWIEKQVCRFAHNAKYWARYWEETLPHFRWRVVDRKGT